ncbi:MAG: helix-turn-helix domain-containing protein [Oscillospiraceae bacterium]|nr:helix-turn-helix domain-containing protein [Oscillospiraceae bacterium]
MIDENKMLSDRQRIISVLTAARLEKGLSQQALADMIGTRRSNICRIEAGGQNISLDMLLKLSAALGKEVSIVLNDKEINAYTEKPRYSLRLYDDELLTFSLNREGLTGMKAEILSVNESLRKLFPLDLNVSGDGIVKWLKRRVIPRNRAFASEIVAQFGLAVEDTKGIIEASKGLSLNDSYWVVPLGFNGRFADYNLYENRFSEVLSLVAYTGNAASHKVFTASPELTTNGMLRKAWRYIEGGGIFLYKGGTEGAANAGNEPYSEFYASQIAEQMRLNVVHYDLENWKGILTSKCRLFTDIDTSFIPIGRIVTSGGLKACLDYYKDIGEEVLEELKDMLVFDAVIYNEDRHYGNFGVLRDNRTGRVTGAAPIFDNGFSLFSLAMPCHFANIGNYAKTRTNPYDMSYDAICQEIMGNRQRRNLRRLMDFTFKRHPTLNLPEERLTAIEEQIQVRVGELLSLPRVKTRPQWAPKL